MEAEYQAATAAVHKALWLQKLVTDLGLARDAVSILMDLQGALNLAHNPITSVHSSHINGHHQLVLKCATHGEAVLDYCATETWWRTL